MNTQTETFLDSETDALMKDYFSSAPGTYPLFVAMANLIIARFKEVTVKIQKTQIAFSSKRNFAFIWLPPVKVKNRPEVYVVFSFGGETKVESPRIVEAHEVQPNRWIHHVIVSSIQDVDAEMLEWLKISYQSARK